ncbi:S-adenosylmethionine:tRNA ribosyltransferase-isomerase [bacterium]|nr:S-adenosylmethionine:tRNA ribosyltransferase-isomerase [bacterium]
MQPEDLLLSSYNYNLPDKQIAQVPSVPAHNAKMLICTPNQNRGYDFQHKSFIELAEQLDDKYLIFLNRTKVFKARIPLH